MAARGWQLVVAASVALALVSMASNITTTAQLSAQADTLLAVRSTASKLLNSGTVWAGLPILSGWLVRRRTEAAAAGIVASLIALAVHYSVGQLLGQFDSTVWVDNWYWGAFAAVLGGPLGLVGAAACRVDRWGLLARLVIPVGAVLEPFFLGMLTTPAIFPWPDRVSSIVSGVILLAAGLAAGTAVLVRHRRRQLAVRSGTRA